MGSTIQELKAVVSADTTGYDQGMERVGRGADDVAQKTNKASKETDQFGKSASTAKDILQSLGVALTLDAMVDFGRDALESANNLEKTEAVVRTISGSQARYNEVLALATDGQQKYGGSLQNQLESLRGLVPLANRYGLELEQLDNVSRRLAVSSPEQGIQGASFAIKEFLASGDTLSLVERFELSRGELNKLKEAAGGDLQARLDGLSEIMNQLGYDQSTLAAATQTNANTYDRLGASVSNATVSIGKFLQEGLKPAAEGAIILADAISGKGLNETLVTLADTFTSFTNGRGLSTEQIQGLSQSLEGLGIQSEATKERINLGATAYDVYSTAAQDAAKSTIEQADAAKLSAEELEKLQQKLDQAADRGSEAQERLADARERYAEQTQQKQEDFARKLETVQREAGERVATIDRDYAERRVSTLADTQAELADIQRDGAAELLSQQQDYQTASEEAAQTHVDKLADFAAKRVDVERDVASRQADAASDYASKIADIDRELADDRIQEAERAASRLADLDERTLEGQRDLRAKMLEEQRDYEQSIDDLLSKSADSQADKAQDYQDKISDAAAKASADREDRASAHAQRLQDLQSQLANVDPDKDKSGDQRGRLQQRIAQEEQAFRLKEQQARRDEELASSIADREFQQAQERAAREEEQQIAKINREREQAQAAALEKAEQLRQELEQQRTIEEAAAAQRAARLDAEAEQDRAKAATTFAEKQAQYQQDLTEKLATIAADEAAEQESYARKTAQRQAAYEQERTETVAQLAERTAQVQAQSEAELAELDTKYQRERAQRLADAQQKIDDLEASFTIEEERRAQSYARQEEQLKQSLGKQLDSYITTQAAMGTITIEEAQKRRQAVAEEFGVTPQSSQRLQFGAFAAGVGNEGAGLLGTGLGVLNSIGLNVPGQNLLQGLSQQNTIIIQGSTDPQQTALAVRDELDRIARQNGSTGISPS